MELPQKHGGFNLPLDEDTVPQDPLTLIIIGTIGISVLVLTASICLWCSQSSSNDRRLDSYSSVKDTVQLEDLLSKPVLADPESVFSEPSIRGYRNNSDSNKSPSAVSDVQSSSYSYSPRETENFKYPGRARNISSTDDGKPASELGSSAPVTREDRSTTLASNDTCLDNTPATESAERKDESVKIDIELASPPAKTNLTKVKPLPKVRSSALETPSFNQSNNRNTPQRSNDMIDKPIKHDKVLSNESEACSQISATDDSCKDQACSKVKTDSNILDQDFTNDKKTAHESASTFNKKVKNSEQEIDTKENNERYEDKEDLIDAGRAESANDKTKEVPLKNMAISNVPNLHAFIADPNVPRFREKILKSCQPGSQDSILCPGRCSFSHEAGHTANGSTKITSPLINMSPILERKVSDSNSISPAASPKPTDSPKILRIREKNSNEDQLVDSDIRNHQPFMRQKSNANKSVEKMPFQIEAKVDGTDPKIPTSNIHANVMESKANVEDSNPDLNESVVFRRSFSQETTESKLRGSNIKTFSLNLQIDFHFGNSELSETPLDDKKTFSPSGHRSHARKNPQVKSKESSEVRIQGTVCPDLNKDNMTSLKYNNKLSANSDMNNKEKILEKCFAEKASANLTGKDRKRRSEPVLMDKCNNDFEVPSVSLRRSSPVSPRFRHLHLHHRRQERGRRGCSVGERLGHEDLSRTEGIDKKNVADMGIEQKRRRIQNDESCEGTQELTSETSKSKESSEESMGSLTGPSKSTSDENRSCIDKSLQTKTDHTKLNQVEVATKTRPSLTTPRSTEIMATSTTHVAEIGDTNETSQSPQPLTGSSDTSRGISHERKKSQPTDVTAQIKNAPKVDLRTANPSRSMTREKAACSDSQTPCSKSEAVVDTAAKDVSASGSHQRQIDHTIKSQGRSDVPDNKPDIFKPKPAPRGGTKVKDEPQPELTKPQKSTPTARPRQSKPLDVDVTPVSRYSHTTSDKQASHGATQASTDKAPSVPALVVEDTNAKNQAGSSRAEESPSPVDDTSEPLLRGKGKQNNGTKDKESCNKNNRKKEEPAPVIEVSDDSDYDNPWDTLDDAVQRASIRYNRRPSRIAAGADTKTLLLKSAEDLGRLMEEADKRRKLRQAAAKSTCPDEDLLSPESAKPTNIPFRRFSPLRHTVKGLISQPPSSTKSNEDLAQISPVTSGSGAQAKGGLSRFQKNYSLHYKHAYRESGPEDELVHYRPKEGRAPATSSPAQRPKSLTAKELAKTLSPGTKKRKN
ncbi:hypothetical protein PoB_006474300 [Plakobranchus ocellatus]|uniref:Uncharacterized protein n=1 Tax=Plakobranchus ocellatus TaxID=259542 RepID=A0AAV4D259_9GAST|nr:hypothetical protein PoB_006474300 [Plakobranchus ocellatus]